MKVIYCFIITLLIVSVKINAQTYSFYGWLYEGEGTYLSVKFNINENKKQVLDTLLLLDTSINNFEVPKDESVKSWKKVFDNSEASKVKIITYKYNDNNISFLTEKLYEGPKTWLRLNFKGKIKGDKIDGILKSDWCPEGNPKEIYTSKDKIIFYKD